MTSVPARENTFKIDFSNFPKRPSFEEIHAFVHNILGLTVEHVTRLQMNHAQNCAHVKCRDLQTAQDTVEQHHEKHELEVNKTKVKVRLYMDDGGVEVKIHDLSENVRNEEIAAFLKQFGDVIAIKEVIWGENFLLKGIPTGVRVSKMVLRRHIKSFVTVQGEQTLVTYRNQPQTCRHCTNPSHPGSTCVENKKLLGQKVDLSKRLRKAAQSSNSHANSGASTSFAQVVGNNSNTTPTLMPNFTILSPTRQAPAAAAVTTMDTQRDEPVNNTTTRDDEPEEPTATGEQMDGIECVTPLENTVGNAADEQNRPVDNSVCVETTTSSVSNFKIPSSAPNLNSISIDISVSESCDSSHENDPFQTVRRSKRLKKSKPQ